MELQLFRLFHNERDMDELTEELNRKRHLMEKEEKKRQKIEDEMKDVKKEHGKIARELTKLEQQIKESVCLNHIIIQSFHFNIFL